MAKNNFSYETELTLPPNQTFSFIRPFFPSLPYLKVLWCGSVWIWNIDGEVDVGCVVAILGVTSWKQFNLKVDIRCVVAILGVTSWKQINLKVDIGCIVAILGVTSWKQFNLKVDVGCIVAILGVTSWYSWILRGIQNWGRVIRRRVHTLKYTYCEINIRRGALKNIVLLTDWGSRKKVIFFSGQPTKDFSHPPPFGLVVKRTAKFFFKAFKKYFFLCG